MAFAFAKDTEDSLHQISLEIDDLLEPVPLLHRILLREKMSHALRFQADSREFSIFRIICVSLLEYQIIPND